MTIRGLVPTSLVDYPGEMCTTLFFGGCNLRCPWCHNRELVEEPWALPEIKEEEVYPFLAERQNWIQAVCLTGGEPTLAPGLFDFISNLKKMGFKVKLDTNGTRPRVLSQLLEARLVDYVAMDIKGPPPKYPRAAGAPVEMAAIEASIKLLKQGTSAYEFRTTVIPGLLTEGDLLAMGKWLAGAACYVLQRFVPRENIIAEGIPAPAPWRSPVLAADGCPPGKIFCQGRGAGLTEGKEALLLSFFFINAPLIPLISPPPCR